MRKEANINAGFNEDGDEENFLDGGFCSQNDNNLENRGVESINDQSNKSIIQSNELLLCNGAHMDLLDTDSILVNLSDDNTVTPCQQPIGICDNMDAHNMDLLGDNDFDDTFVSADNTSGFDDMIF